MTGAAEGIRLANREAETPVHEIAFTDRQGNPLTAPIFSVDGAYPGMPSSAVVFTITNRGSMAVRYDVSVTVGSPGESDSLADILRVTVRCVPDDRVVFRGRLRDLAVKGAGPLSAGESDSYNLITRWPEQSHAEDNRLQGHTLDFGFHARSYDGLSVAGDDLVGCRSAPRT